MRRQVLYTLLALALVLGLGLPLATPVSAASDVSIELVTVPPGYILNDGIQVQQFRWTIEFLSEPDYYTFEVRTYPGGVLIDTPETNVTRDLSGQSSPVHNDQWVDYHTWNVPAGMPPGEYRAQVTYYSTDGYEADAGRIFEIRQRVQVFKYNDLDGDGQYDDLIDAPLSGWAFDVTGPENWTGDSTGASGYLINSATGLPYRDFLQPGDYTVTETLQAGWRNTDPGGIAPHQKTFTVPHPDGETIVVQFGNEELRPDIDLEKHTNGEDADVPTGPDIQAGDPVTWTYYVKNTGNVDLTDIVVTDDQPGVTPVYVSGDDNLDGILNPGETWVYEAIGAAVAGQYANIGTATGTPPVGDDVSDTDPSHYFGSDLTLGDISELGDTVWNDLNRDGIQDDDEPGIEGVTVRLYDCDGNWLASTTTDENGQYMFSDLMPGGYRVEFVLPAGYAFSPQYQGGNPELDSNAHRVTGLSECVTLPEGITDPTIDAGMYEQERDSPPAGPSMNEWGMLIMIGVFAGLLVWTLRRRQQALATN